MCPSSRTLRWGLYAIAATVATVPVAALLQSSADAWSRATAHPFLDAVREGTLPQGAFDAWLIQDHHFVGDLLRFQARLLARAPRPARAVLAGGTVGLVQELEWFEDVAAQRGLRLDGERQPATTAFADLLSRLDAAPVAEALVGLWAIERAYLDAWSFAAPGAPPYRPYVEHWTTPEFAAYVTGLEGAADASTGSRREDSDAVFADVALAETQFWDMAWAGDKR